METPQVPMVIPQAIRLRRFRFTAIIKSKKPHIAEKICASARISIGIKKSNHSKRVGSPGNIEDHKLTRPIEPVNREMLQRPIAVRS